MSLSHDELLEYVSSTGEYLLENIERIDEVRIELFEKLEKVQRDTQLASDDTHFRIDQHRINSEAYNKQTQALVKSLNELTNVLNSKVAGLMNKMNQDSVRFTELLASQSYSLDKTVKTQSEMLRLLTEVNHSAVTAQAERLFAAQTSENREQESRLTTLIQTKTKTIVRTQVFLTIVILMALCFFTGSGGWQWITR